MNVNWLNAQSLRHLYKLTILPNFKAGLISGIVALSFSIAYGALIFAGDLSKYFAFGTGSALGSAVLATLLLAWRSNFYFAIASSDPQVPPVLALIVAAVASEVQATGNSDAVFSTIWVAIALCSIGTGVCLFTLGQLRLGYLVRFVPYPVVGGFLAGAGYLLIRGAFKVTLGVPLDWQVLPHLWQADVVWHWLPSLIFAIFLQAMVRHFQNLLLMPLSLVGAIASTYGIFALTGISIPQAIAEGWIFDPIVSSQSQFNQLANWQIVIHNWGQVDWQALSAQTGTLMALILLVSICILLNASELEINTQTDIDLDRELKVSGIANLGVGCVGGMLGYLSLSRSMLNYKAGANSRLAGVIASLVCALTLWWGETILFYFPKPVLSSLLFYVGIGLLIDWLYKAWFKLLPLEYFLLASIVAIVAIAGFLRGIGVGIVFACLLFAFNYSHISVIKYALSGANHHSNLERSQTQTKLLQEKGAAIYILCLQGYLFFGTANSLINQVKQRLLDPSLPTLRFLIIDFRLVSAMDSSAILSFVKLKQLAQKHDVQLVLTQVQPSNQAQLQQLGCIPASNSESSLNHNDVCQAFLDLDRGVEWCEEQLITTMGIEPQASFPLVLQLSEMLLIEESIPQLISRIQTFMAYLEKISLPAQQFVFHQGDLPEELYFIESGQVTLLLELPNGQQKRLRSLCEGTVIGEIGLYKKSPRSASAITDRASILYRLSQTALTKMESEDPKLAAAFHQFIVRLLADRLAHSNKELEILLG